jgi:hypothetical protein
MPKTIYLDSSDFSDLSASQLSEDNGALLAQLCKCHDDGTARYYFSLIHLSEAVHSAGAHKESAVRRARLISRLCGSNTLRIPNEIFGLELKKAIANMSDARLSPSELLSAPSEWFGLSCHADMQNWRRKIDEKIENHIAHLPRRERRRIKSDMKFSKEIGRQRWREVFRALPRDILTDFPFNLLSREFVVQWMLRDKTDQQFLELISKVLSDPTAMIEHILDATNERASVYEPLRRQGQEIQQAMEKRLKILIERLSALVGRDNELPITRAFKTGIPKVLIYRGVMEGYASQDVSHLADKDVIHVISLCPALSAFANLFIHYAYSLFDANWQRFTSGKSNIAAGEPSDFGDLLHAAYAPYVDAFRCDAHFGALLKQDPDVRSRIVDKRRALLHILQSMHA